MNEKTQCCNDAHTSFGVIKSQQYFGESIATVFQLQLKEKFMTETSQEKSMGKEVARNMAKRNLIYQLLKILEHENKQKTQ